MSHIRLALIRLVPVSYFWICWNLMPTSFYTFLCFSGQGEVELIGVIWRLHLAIRKLL